MTAERDVPKEATTFNSGSRSGFKITAQTFEEVSGIRRLAILTPDATIIRGKVPGHVRILKNHQRPTAPSELR